MNRLRKLFESIAYAGMKPGGTRQGKRMGWLGPLAAPVTRFLDGGAAPSDPFYLTNRTIGQRLRLAVVIAIPCALVVGAIALATMGYFDAAQTVVPPAPTLTPEQVAAKMLPNIDKDLKIDSNRDIGVSDVRVERGSTVRVVGTATNNTGHSIDDVELVFDLTDVSGSRLGAVSTKVARIPAKGSAGFSFAVQQHTAAFALVRDIKEQ